MEKEGGLLDITPSGTSGKSQPGAWAPVSSHPGKSPAKRAKDMSPKGCHQDLQKPNPRK